MTTLASRPEIAAIPAASRVVVTEDHRVDPSELSVEREEAGTMVVVFAAVLDVLDTATVPTLVDVLDALGHDVTHTILT